MSFLFASSHLPEVKRPADEDDDVQPMQRSGMVRAFSHLPQPVVAAPAWPRPSGQAPAPASRPAWAAAPESPSGHEPSDGHDAEPDDDADDDHGSSASASTGAHEPDDGRPWYLPRITAADLQPEGGEHDDADSGSAGRPPKKWEPELDPDPGFDGTPPKEWGKPTRDPGFEVTAPKEWGKPTRDPGFDGSPQDVHNGTPAPDTTGAAPAPRSAALPYGRLFEKRPTPSFSAPNGRHQSLAGSAEPHNLVNQPQGSPAEDREYRRSLFQNVADTWDAMMPQAAAAEVGAQQQGSQLPPSAISHRASNEAPRQPQSSSPTNPANAKPLLPQKPAEGSIPSPVINATGARQNSGARSDSRNASKTPGELEYALKFIGGTFIDGPLNAAVAIFGGPGKYSYNPSPVRRSLGVDDPLPKMDRRSYNQLQDGAEMLVFSLAGAVNPKNRVQVAIPTPPSKNADGSPLDPQAASRWLKEYRTNVQKTGSGEFQIGVNDNKLQSRLVHGTLDFEVSRQSNDGIIHGADMFNSMLKFYGSAVKAIQGNWVQLGDNLAKVNSLTQSGTPLKSAVQMTWTGLQAAAHGYTEVEINHSIGENGKFTDIQVTFRKPGG